MKEAKPSKAILIAAGRGKRLGDHTDGICKGMVAVGERAIIAWQWQALYRAGVRTLVVIRGYLAPVMTKFATELVAGYPGATVEFVDNVDWQHNNVLLSLACARQHLNDACVLLYSDIIFTDEVAAAAVEHRADIGLVIDRDFRRIYEGRTEHPLDEGEVSDLDGTGNVRRVGKRALPANDAIGEFIGLVKLSAVGAQTLRSQIDSVVLAYRGREHEPYQRAKSLQQGYLTDVLQDLIDRGTPIEPIFIEGQWREIDTPQDLQRAQTLVSSPTWR